jgi:hypothetical protein
MTRITKGLAIAAMVATLGGAGLAVAQTAAPSAGMTAHVHGDRHGMMGGARGAGFGDRSARLDRLKTELAIRPEQTAAWDGYVKAVTDSSTQMRTIRASIDVDKLRAMNWTDHQAYVGQIHDQQAAAFRSVQTAATTLLASLDDTQKSHLLLPVLEHAGGGMHRPHSGR